MALIESLTPTVATNYPLGVSYIPYHDLPLPAPTETRVGVPEAWFRYLLYEPLFDVTPRTNYINDAGLSRVRSETAPTIPPKIGDVVSYQDVQGVVVRINNDNDPLILIDVTIDAPFDAGVPTDNEPAWISYTDRKTRLGALELTINNGVDAPYKAFPKTSGRLVINGAVSDGDVYTAYYINVEEYAKSAYAERTLYQTNFGSDGTRVTIDVNWFGELVSFSDGIQNCTYPPASQASSIINGQDRRLQICGRETYEAGAFSFDSGNLQVPTIPSAPIVKLPLGDASIYLLWVTRYGGYQIAPFNYDGNEDLRTSIIATRRQRYDTSNVMLEGLDGITLNSGLLPSELAEWYEDLMLSPWVWLARELKYKAVGANLIVDYGAMVWVPYRIEPNTFTIRAIDNELMTVAVRLVKEKQRLTYRR